MVIYRTGTTMVSGFLVRNRYWTLLDARRLKSFQISSEIGERATKSAEQSSWKDLANMCYGKKTIVHREKLRKTFCDLRRVLEKNEMKLIEIGSYAVCASTPSSDLDVLIIPYANDQTEERIDEFKRNMDKPSFRRAALIPLTKRLSNAGILEGKAEAFLHAKVPIIHGKTRSGVSFDVQIGEIDTIYSSNFVRLAFQLDPRQILVYHWLRAQTEKYKLYGGKSNLFTAFHLYMIILHFAQSTGILPVLMDEYTTHLSRACHWRDLTEEYRNGKDIVLPLYTTEDVDKWAPTLITQLVEYYGTKDFTRMEIDVGRARVKERCTNNLLLIEPFHDQTNGVCRVSNGATLMNMLFAKLSNKLS